MLKRKSFILLLLILIIGLVGCSEKNPNNFETLEIKEDISAPEDLGENLNEISSEENIELEEADEVISIEDLEMDIYEEYFDNDESVEHIIDDIFKEDTDKIVEKNPLEVDPDFIGGVSEGFIGSESTTASNEGYDRFKGIWYEKDMGFILIIEDNKVSLGYPESELLSESKVIDISYPRANTMKLLLDTIYFDYDYDAEGEYVDLSTNVKEEYTLTLKESTMIFDIDNVVSYELIFSGKDYQDFIINYNPFK